MYEKEPFTLPEWVGGHKYVQWSLPTAVFLSEIAYDLSLTFIEMVGV